MILMLKTVEIVVILYIRTEICRKLLVEIRYDKDDISKANRLKVSGVPFVTLDN